MSLRMIFTYVISVVIILIVSLFSRAELKANEKEQDIAAFHPTRGIEVNEKNLVDLLSGLPLTLPFSKVDWGGSTLTMDLKFASSGRNPQLVYENMAQLIHFGFAQTTNVRQIFLRFVIVDDWMKTKSLLLAVDARRNEISAEDLEFLRTLTAAPDTKLQEKLHLTYTSVWKAQFE